MIENGHNFTGMMKEWRIGDLVVLIFVEKKPFFFCRPKYKQCVKFF